STGVNVPLTRTWVVTEASRAVWKNVGATFPHGPVAAHNWSAGTSRNAASLASVIPADTSPGPGEVSADGQVNGPSSKMHRGTSEKSTRDAGGRPAATSGVRKPYSI